MVQGFVLDGGGFGCRIQGGGVQMREGVGGGGEGGCRRVGEGRGCMVEGDGFSPEGAGEELRVKGGGHFVEGGGRRWRVEGGGSRVEGGRWRVESGRFRVEF